MLTWLPWLLAVATAVPLVWFVVWRVTGRAPATWTLVVQLVRLLLIALITFYIVVVFKPLQWFRKGKP